MTLSKQPPLTVVYLDHTAKWSGGEIALLRTVTALDRARVEPVVVLAAEGPFADRLREAHIETHILPLSERVREVRKETLGGVGALVRQASGAIALWSYAGKVAQFARGRGAKILHCNSLKSDIYGAVAGRMARIPVLWHVRDHIDPGYLPGPAVKLFRALARTLPAFVVTNSDSTTEKLFPSGADARHCRAVHDGLADDELTAPQPPVYTEWRSDPPRVGMVGRLVQWKGQHVFLDAAKRLTEAGTEAQYVLIGAPLFGEEDYEAALKQQAASLGNRVEFTGFRTDIPELLRGLDILVHASVTPEPFGQVVIEGMAEGLPVVASNGGGVQEIVQDGVNGLLTPMGNAEALAASLGTLLRDPRQGNRLARAGWQTVREKFTAAHSARALEAVYDVMMSSAAAPRQLPAQRRASRSDSVDGAVKTETSENARYARSNRP